MSPVTREQLSQTIAQMVPRIIQGAHLDFLATQRITHSQFFLIIAIHSHHQCPMKTLAGNMHVSMPTVSGIVNRLVKLSYVHRLNAEGDRRQVVVELTRRGEQIVEQFQTAIGLRWQEVLKSLSSRDREIFNKIIDKLKEAMNVSR